jgi:hypothetical protein
MSTPVTFDVVQSVWDENKPHLLWVVVQSSHETGGEYAARLWFTLDGSNPQDWRNEKRELAKFDCCEMDGAPEDVPTTTIVTGLRATRLAFGLPWCAAIQGIEKGDKINLFVEFCQEVNEDGKLEPLTPTAINENTLMCPPPESEQLDAFETQLAELLCEDPWHKTDSPLTKNCPLCGYSYEDDVKL